MLGRLIFGFVLGLLVGVIAAAGLVVGLKMTVFAGGAAILFAYLAAAAVGAVTGLVTGKPVWAANAKVEASIKAFFGALLGAGALFALRQWAGSVAIDLGAYGPGGPAAIGSLPAAALPLIAATLGALFGLDNTNDPEGDADAKKAGARKRVAASADRGPRVSAVSAAGVEEDDAEQDASAVGKRAKP
jgi:hypothetical protein